VKLTNTMAFMFETRYPQHVTKYAANLKELQGDYRECWKGIERLFNGKA